MDEGAAGAERMGKACLPTGGARRRRRRSTADAAELSPACATDNLDTEKFDSRHSVMLLTCGVVVLASVLLVRAVVYILRLERAGRDNTPTATPCYGDHCATRDRLFGNVSGQTVDPCEDFGLERRFPELAVRCPPDGYRQRIFWTLR
ncbi:uncharacterized protein [Dermacentor andersoni]|uniref:uncharacterized protein n=1 Tax=Dermacentor andersoni TaxID=34620 RepID=UPI002415CDB3|nr:uncharacterized protein LOC126543499 [Dermacentor andersoni]